MLHALKREPRREESANTPYRATEHDPRASQAQARELQFYGGGGRDASDTHAIAARGVAGSGHSLPHLDRIQASFGRHDVSAVQAYTNNAAAAAASELGGQAYATGNRVAFGNSSPTLFTAAHEAAHVVQQRHGVALKGGVGQSGDRYEQHADAVAEKVVRGESAEALLDQYAGSGGTHSAVQREDPPAGTAIAGGASGAANAAGGGTTTTGGKDPWRDKINRNMRDVKTLHEGAFDKQMMACRTLKTTAGKEDPPSLLETALLAAVEIALVAATGGIGGAVAVGVTKRLTKFAVDPKGAADAIKVIGDMSKDVAKHVTKKMTGKAGGWISKATSQYPEGDSERAAKICFDAQEKGLIDAKVDCGLEYNKKWEQALAMGEQGYKVSQALLESMQETYKQAEAIQRDKSVQQWAVYQAQSLRGATKSGSTNMGKNSPGPFTADRGVLKLYVTWFEGKKPTITSASMPGMNSALRPDIAAKKLKDLQVPIQVKLKCGPELGWIDRNIGKKVQPNTTISRDEKGGVWVNKNHTTALYWMAVQTGTRTQEYAGRRWYTTAADPHATTAAVFRRLDNYKPPLS